MLEKGAQAPAGSFLQDSQSPQSRVLRAGNLGGSQPPGEMRLGARMSCAESALLFRLSSAHRARDGQYVSQREFGLHINIIQLPLIGEMVNLALKASTWPQNGNLLGGNTNFGALHQHYASILEHADFNVRVQTRTNAEFLGVWSELDTPIADASPHSWRKRCVLPVSC
jgi:hypothetical protein